MPHPDLGLQGGEATSWFLCALLFNGSLENYLPVSAGGAMGV